MKKFFVLAVAVLASLVFAGCEEDIDNDYTITNKSDYILLNVHTYREHFGDINSGSSSTIKIGKDSTYTEIGSDIYLQLNTVVGIRSYLIKAGLASNNRQYTITNNTVLKEDVYYGSRTRSLKEFADVSMFIIRNQSGVAITDITWNGTEFSGYINPGGNTTNREVQAGSGYIYFKKSSVFARTSEIFTVGVKEQAEFVFTNNRVVINLETNQTTTLFEL
jgi:hypothetical protein